MDYIVNVRREITINNYAVLMNHDKIWRVGKIFAPPLLLVGTKKKKCKIGGDLPGRSRAETFFHRYPSVETRDIKLMIKIKINQLIKKKKPHTKLLFFYIYWLFPVWYRLFNHNQVVIYLKYTIFISKQTYQLFPVPFNLPNGVSSRVDTICWNFL